MVIGAPVPQKVNDHPSTYRRVKMAHKFGIVAIDAVRGAYLTTNTNDPNSKSTPSFIDIFLRKSLQQKGPVMG